VRQSKCCDHSLVDELKTDDSYERNRKLALLSPSRTLDKAPCSLRRDAGNEWEDDCEETKSLRNRKVK